MASKVKAPKKNTYTVEAEIRLDMFLLEKLEGKKAITRSKLKNWIEGGAVVVNDKKVEKAGFLLKPGYKVEFTKPNDNRSPFEHYDLEVPILFEDDDIIVIDKPFGLSMHPGAGNNNKTLVNALSKRLSSWKGHKGARPGVVHRLDKDTTGVVVVAKNEVAHLSLSKQFADRSVGRAYKALVFCTPRGKRAVNLADSGRIETLLGRDPHSRLKIAVLKSGGKRAVTNWSLIEATPYGRLLDVRLETGRTHQIRVHFNHVASPVVGDKTYGDFSGLPSDLKAAAGNFGRQALHAYLLEFEHPTTHKRVSFKCDLPSDFGELLRIFRAYKF